MLRYYKTLISVRKQEPALRNLNRTQLNVEENTGSQTLVLHRWHEGEHVFSLMNFSKELQQIDLPTYKSDWQKLLDSADPMWDGPMASPGVISGRATVTIQPESLVIYKNVATS
jgi:maltooligosyltrehalose trehalohydrolase